MNTKKIFTTNHIFFKVILCVGLIILLSAFQLQKIGPAEFYNLLNNTENAVLLDVRVLEEYCEDRIPNAIWAGKKIVLDSLLKELDKKSTFFIYCEICGRTTDVAKILKKAKIKHVVILDGGIVAWKRENFPIDNEQVCE